MTQLLIASGNPGKLRELRALLDLPGLTLVSPRELGIRPEVKETENDYRMNAHHKALVFAEASGLWTLADDSGLEVDALEGAPGPRSARLGKAHFNDADRRRVLLQLLQPHPRPWRAHFHCTVALVSPLGELNFAEGICHGEIIDIERGTEGFGYDPIFLVQGTDRTMAELRMQEKNRISHRARAIEELLPKLRQKLGLEDTN
jgi:XTP/dITP diphosphohydrolase